jgi:hypothetical protein
MLSTPPCSAGRHAQRGQRSAYVRGRRADARARVVEDAEAGNDGDTDREDETCARAKLTTNFLRLRKAQAARMAGDGTPEFSHLCYVTSLRLPEHPRTERAPLIGPN